MVTDMLIFQDYRAIPDNPVLISAAEILCYLVISPFALLSERFRRITGNALIKTAVLIPGVSWFFGEGDGDV